MRLPANPCLLQPLPPVLTHRTRHTLVRDITTAATSTKAFAAATASTGRSSRTITNTATTTTPITFTITNPSPTTNTNETTGTTTPITVRKERNTMSNPPLPPLPEITRLSPSLIRILASNPGPFTLQGTNTYLLGTGPSRLLIDTGEGRAGWIGALGRVLEQEEHDNGKGVTLAAVILTHRHRDHVGGVGDLWRSEFGKGVEVWKFQPDVVDVDPGGEGAIQEMHNNQTFAVPGATLRAVHTPGHTADHAVLVWEEEGAVFTGDSVLGHGTAVFEDLGAYLESLERTRRLFGQGENGNGGKGKGKRAYPGHGEVIEDGPGRIAEYIRHRTQREEQVVQTLRSRVEGGGVVEGAASGGGGGENGNGNGNGNGAWTAMELVRSIYRDVPESLHPAAAGGVLQILRKLQREGRVTADGEGERWRLAGAGSGRSAL